MSKDPRSRQEVTEEQSPHRSTSLNSNLGHTSNSQESLRNLQDVLRRGVAVETMLWSFNTADWVSGIQAADIDNDGDIEILVASRDGYLRALTRRGAVKWERLLEGHYISAICPVPYQGTLTQSQARIIVGTRSGNVFALDKSGEKLPDWQYKADRVVRQIYISAQTPEHVIIGSEDRCIHVLDSATGKPRWAKYRTDGRVRCVFCCDIDGDGKEEILGGSGDTYLYILNQQGHCLYKLPIGQQVCALFAAPLEPSGPIHIITSSNRKDLTAWMVTRRGKKGWSHKKVWEKSPRDNLFGDRVQSICVADIDNDYVPEILVGSEDGHLYILDHHGTPLWKHRFGNCVFNVSASDINSDGQVEILAGTEESGAYALHVELDKNLYQLIREAYNDAVHAHDMSEITKELSFRERTLLKDFTNEVAPQHHAQMEMATAIDLMQQGFFEKALAIFLRLLQQRVQYCWSQPFETKGHIWTECFGNIADGPTQEILVGTDEGSIYAIDIDGEEEKQLWVKNLGNHVRTLQTGRTDPNGFDIIVALLSDHRLVMLNNEGEIIKEHTIEDKQGWASSVSIHKSGESHTINEIVIGYENNKVSIWDAQLQRSIATIATPQGVGTVYEYDITGDGIPEIIGGSIGNQVYVYNRQGEELWRFETQDRVRALCVEDIDKDGHAEIIVGSEDRNVYVLDHEGHLKWRYRTTRNVLDVEVCDIQLENDPQDEKERKWKVLVSGGDNYLYVLSADGDVLWKHKSNNRIRAVYAQDLNHDGKFEIAMASENQLELLQILNRKEIIEYSQRCWHEVLDPNDHRGSTMQLTYRSDEYIRAFALAKLAGQIERHQEEDFTRFQAALRDDDSPQVKRELIRAIGVLSRVPSFQEENAREARLLLQHLSADLDDDIRLAIVEILPSLIEIGESFCFEYLEYFTHNVDIWVRRAVVRQLDTLIEQSPERVLLLLLKTAKDEEEWIRQETGRVLAHYFDTYPQLLVRDMLTLLYNGTDPALLQQISHSARIPAVKDMFHIFVKLLMQVSDENLADILNEAVAAMRVVNALEPILGEELLEVYEEFRQLFSTKTITAIARYQRITRSNMLIDVPAQSLSVHTYSIKHIKQLFDALQQVAQNVKAYERRETIGDRASSLLDALDTLDKVRNELHQEEMRQLQKLPGRQRLPENIILSSLVEQWSRVIKRELNNLRGDARLTAHIRNKVVQPEAEVVISLGISNTGRSPADNVRVELEESSDFDIVGRNWHILTEVSTNNSATVDFTIRPHVPAPRLGFQLTYDDAERRAKRESFADVVVIQGQERPYQPIPNPYTSGTPIRDRGMFYGRQEDLESLRDKLSSLTANKVVVLSGQRRVGKTSLIYQLANDLSSGPYAPVLIDLQSLALVSDVGQLLMGFASRVQDEVLHYKGVHVTLPPPEAFGSNPTATFDDFLVQVLRELQGSKLVFLLDEFEKLQEQINKGVLNQNLLNYLRSLMQHRQGLNFLLAGAPAIHYITEGYWSVFFNIALHHSLSKLKPEEATDLITQPISPYLEYDPLALERVRRLTGDQPYLIHVISESLITYCNKQRKSYVTVNDVNTVLDLILEEQTSSIRWIWEQSSPTERFILSILAQEKGVEGQVFTVNDIRAEYGTQGVPYIGKQVTDALQKLVKDDIVEARHNGTQFRIPIGLTKEWLRKAKPPERVVREDLPSDA